MKDKLSVFVVCCRDRLVEFVFVGNVEKYNVLVGGWSGSSLQDGMVRAIASKTNVV